MNAVRNAIDKSLAERDQNVDKFCSALDKDIADLGKQVKQVKQEAQVNQIVILAIFLLYLAIKFLSKPSSQNEIVHTFLLV